jgi:uncharacterized metal-binding protein YceD (DUF177 family)
VSDSEFSRAVKARHLPPEPLTLEATAAERRALAERFGVVAVDRLSADIALSADKDAVLAIGALSADLVQTCAVSGEDFPLHIEEPVALRFVAPVARAAEEDLELPADEADEIEFTGDTFDLGEAIAQTLALAIDPYACGPAAEAARAEAGLAGDDQPRGPLADLLAALKKD